MLTWTGQDEPAHQILVSWIVTSAEEGYVFSSVCLSVCLFVYLSVGLLANSEIRILWIGGGLCSLSIAFLLKVKIIVFIHTYKHTLKIE